MVKILLIASACLILVFIVVAIYCTLLVAGHCDRNNEENAESTRNIFFRRKICTKCKTGKNTYDLDPHSEFCPYIECWKRNKCSFYEPIDKAPQKSFWRGLRSKQKDGNSCGF